MGDNSNEVDILEFVNNKFVIYGRLFVGFGGIDWYVWSILNKCFDFFCFLLVIWYWVSFFNDRVRFGNLKIDSVKGMLIQT